jgi:hypothetical protein
VWVLCLGRFWVRVLFWYRAMTGVRVWFRIKPRAITRTLARLGVGASVNFKLLGRVIIV